MRTRNWITALLLLLVENADCKQIQEIINTEASQTRCPAGCPGNLYRMNRNVNCKIYAEIEMINLSDLINDNPKLICPIVIGDCLCVPNSQSNNNTATMSPAEFTSSVQSAQSSRQEQSMSTQSANMASTQTGKN